MWWLVGPHHLLTIFLATLSDLKFFSFSLFATFYWSLSLFCVWSCKIAPTSFWNWLCFCWKREKWIRWKYVQPPGDKIFRFSMKKGGINVYGEIFGISMHFMTEGCTCGYGEVELVTNSWSSSHPSSSSDFLILATFLYI